MKNKVNHILAVSILRLQKYNFKVFKLDEIVLLEWLLVKSRSFSFQWFYYSYRRITEETGIKRARLDQILKRFSKVGFVTIETRGYPKQNQFFVNIQRFFDKGLYKPLYKNPDQETDQFFESLKNEFLICSEAKPKQAPAETDKIVEMLNNVFNARRKMQEGRKLSESRLALSSKARADPETAVKIFDPKSLKNSFTAYFDNVLKGYETPEYILPYFLTRSETGDFVLITKYLDIFNLHYEITN